MGKSAPSSPDPYKSSDAQWQANKKALHETAKINAVSQFSPYGSTTFVRDPKTGVPTKQVVKLSAPNQQFLNISNRTRNTLGRTAEGMAGTAFEAPDDSAKIADTMYQRKLGMVSPELDRAQKSLDQQLMDRGLPIGSEVYRDEQNRLAKTRGDTLASISQDSILAGGQEQDRQLQYALTQRALPFNELSSYLSGQPMQTPQFSSQPGYQVQAPDIQGQINQNYQNQLQQYNQQQSGFANGLFGLGSAAISAFSGLSDRRTKKDTRKIGKMDNGLNLWSFRYKWEGADDPIKVGFMADEVREVAPEAVMTGADGFDRVDYGAAVEAMA
jgi:hypothetical protein